MKEIKFTIGNRADNASGGIANTLRLAALVLIVFLSGYLAALVTDAHAAESVHEIGEVRDDGYVWSEFKLKPRTVIAKKHLAAGCEMEFGYYSGYKYDENGNDTNEKLDLKHIDWDYNAKEAARWQAHNQSEDYYVTLYRRTGIKEPGCICKALYYEGSEQGGAWSIQDFKAPYPTKVESNGDFQCWATPDGKHDPNCTNPAHWGEKTTEETTPKSDAPETPTTPVTPTVPDDPVTDDPQPDAPVVTQPEPVTDPETDAEPPADTADGTVTVYRLYNPYNGDHHYTTSRAEYDSLSSSGWRGEGEGWRAPETGEPVHRLYNQWSGEHHYTTSENEMRSLTASGWTYEGIGWYSPVTRSTTTAVYRVFNAYQTGPGAHHYTTSAAEKDTLVKAGWADEGTCWYAL